MTCKEIQRSLFRHFNKSQAIIAFNTTRVLAHETDVLVLRKSGTTTEIEVKVSRSDFKADFRKTAKHKQMIAGYRHGPQYFYYACPEGMIKPEEVPDYAGLYHVVRRYGWPGQPDKFDEDVVEVKKAPRLHKIANAGIHERICLSLMHHAFLAFKNQ